MTEEKHTSSDSLYLQKVEFKKEDRKSALSFFINNIRVVFVLIISLFLFGGVSLSQMPLESNPEVKIPYGIVTVTLPGASPEDVEELVIEKVESKLVNLSGVKTVTSVATNSLGYTAVEFQADQDVDDSIRRLRDAAATITGLPDNASDPMVSEVAFENMPIWTLVLTGPYDDFTLRRYADKLDDALSALPGTSDVMVSGGDIAEVRITYDTSKLQKYGISLEQANGVIAASNIALPLGTIDISKYRYSVRTEGKFSNASELRKLPITQRNGQIIRLQDIASVAEKARSRDAITIFSINGSEPQNAVSINVVKKTGSSITKLIDTGNKVIEELMDKEFPDDMEVRSTLDYAYEIRKDIGNLMRDGLTTILLVTLVLFLFTGIKEAFIAGLAIPMVFAASFGIMNLTGITLNFLSLFSLILALGLLVDNAIVVVQATKQYIRTGKFTPEEAVLLVFRDFRFLLATTTLTTIWSFLPLLLASGIMGQFLKSIPITVSATLISSLFIAYFINHPLAVVFERVRCTRNHMKIFFVLLGIINLGIVFSFLSPGYEIYKLAALLIFGTGLFILFFIYRKSLREKLIRNEELLILESAYPEKIKERIRQKYIEPQGKKVSFFKKLYTGILKFEKILPIYGRALNKLISRKLYSYALIICVFFAFIGAIFLPASGILKSEFFSSADFIYMYVNIEGPPGLLSSETKKVTDEIQERLVKEPAIDNFSLVVGAEGVDMESFTSVSSSGSNTNKAQFSILLYEWKDRPVREGDDKREKSYEFAARLRDEFSNIRGAKIEVQEVQGGPPSGADFDASIYGPDLKVLEELGNQYKEILSEIPGTVNEKISIVPSPGEFDIRLDFDKMQLKGTTAMQVGMALRTAMSGTEVTKIFQEGDDVRVVAELNESAIKNVNDLKTLALTNNLGQTFQLGEVADIEIGSSLTSISRLNQQRYVSVVSAVEKPYLPSVVLQEFQNKVADMELPDGYTVEYGGLNETNTESVYSIFQAMLVALALAILTLIIQFNSFRKTFVVLVTIPLAVTGVMYGIYLSGLTLSFPVLIGVLSLFGIVLNNAVILVDKFNLNMKVGIPFQEAVVDAAQSRIEAIFLTSICTVIGMIPITFTSEIWTGLGASLIFGLISSTFLTSFVVPVLYSLMLRKTSLKQERIRALQGKTI